MPRMDPYLQRRGYGLFFRIAVPTDLRHIIGGREITKTLSTSDKGQAVPIALEYAACIKRMFYELRAGMAELDQEKLMLVVKLAKEKIRRSDAEEARWHLEQQHQDEITRIRRDAERQLQQEKLQAENKALKRALAGFSASSAPSPSTVPVSLPAATKQVSTPTLKTVVDAFLNKYQQDKKPAMYKKHKPVLTMLLEVVGDKRIDELKQADINEVFDLISQLPPRWADECRQRKLSIRQLAELDFDVTLGPKTLEDTYIASIRPFLKAAKKDWQDQGFPLGLTTDGIEYLGDREEGENKQRAFKPDELKRLFEGPQMASFAATPEDAHYFWLPHLGLFTGARVNEICQLNPQTDILQDGTGSWFFWITKETEADPRIRKSVKTGDSRQVPIHKKLIELGFLDYFKRVKKSGAKLLFPKWQPINQKASGEAEKWFRQFLQDTGLRDDTPKAKIVGMHAFRHTLLTYGAMQKPPLSLFCITGHAQDETPIAASGAGKGYLTLSLLSPLSDRKALLDQLDYNLAFHVPVAA